MKNKDRRKRVFCRCQPPKRMDTPGVVETTCRWGCAEFRCHRCQGYLGGWGAVGCRCQGYLRWVGNWDMAPALAPEAVKPSLPKGRRHRQRKRK